MTARPLHKVTGYRFFDHDPIVDAARTMMDAAGFSFSQMADDANGGVVESTIRNLAYGNTRFPRFNTIRVITEICRGRLVIEMNDGHRLRVDYDDDGNRAKLMMANGSGWRAIDPVKPKEMRDHVRQRREDRRKKKTPAPSKLKLVQTDR